MQVLFDKGVPLKLRRSFPMHGVTTVRAPIVLRAFNTKLESYLPLVPEIEATLAGIQPREVVYIYADPKLALKDQRKGRGRKSLK